jgi:hypothetical protein
MCNALERTRDRTALRKVDTGNVDLGLLDRHAAMVPTAAAAAAAADGGGADATRRTGDRGVLGNVKGEVFGQAGEVDALVAEQKLEVVETQRVRGVGARRGQRDARNYFWPTEKKNNNRK